MRQQGNPVFSEETVKQFYIFSKETVRQFITCLGWGWPYASNAPPRGHIWTQIIIKVSKKQLSFLNLHLTWLWNWMIKLFCYLIIEVKAQYWIQVYYVLYCTVGANVLLNDLIVHLNVKNWQYLTFRFKNIYENL